jgi:hypothetical protein
LKQGDSDEESSKPTETQPTDAVAVNPEERIEKSGSSGSLPLLAFSMESEDQSGAIN